MILALAYLFYIDFFVFVVVFFPAYKSTISSATYAFFAPQRFVCLLMVSLGSKRTLTVVVVGWPTV